jgi:hypothetical protein
MSSVRALLLLSLVAAAFASECVDKKGSKKCSKKAKKGKCTHSKWLKKCAKSCGACEEDTCATWCNPYNCADSPAACATCAFCGEFYADRTCESWCNVHSCFGGMADFCTGCSFCANDACPCTGNEGVDTGAYPADFGNSCSAWDGEESYCKGGGSSFGADWCDDSWCYVDPENCAYPTYPSTYFDAPPNLAYSYKTCDLDFHANTYVGLEVYPQRNGCPCIGTQGNNPVESMSNALDGPWDFASTCAAWDGAMSYCAEGGSSFGADWCSDPFCYVDANRCDVPTYSSSYYEGQLTYSYKACDTSFYGNSWVGEAAELPFVSPPATPGSMPFDCGLNAKGQGNSVPDYYVCDGEQDCYNGSDEDNCEEHKCLWSQFECEINGVKTCIPAHMDFSYLPDPITDPEDYLDEDHWDDWICDGEVDCDDGSDEDPKYALSHPGYCAYNQDD